jgi:circadian clock protein KaiC
MSASAERLPTGVEGFDSVLSGGLHPNRVYLVEGVPGSGKTTLSLQFLLEGARRGEAVLHVTLSETAEELAMVAASHGWTLDGIRIRELVPSAQSLDPEQQYTMFHPSEVELTETTKMIITDVAEAGPTRVVIDSLTELRLLAGDALRYRRQILGLKRFFASRSCTVLLLDDLIGAKQGLHVRSLAHGVFSLEQISVEYGADRRRLRVVKYRATEFRGGFHDYVIRRGGLEVFPRLVASEHRRHSDHETLGSGIADLDSLLGGGIVGGTSTLIVGGAGTGKSTIAAQFAAAAAARGQRAALFIFDESTTTLLTRTDGLGIDLRAGLEAGRVSIQPVDPAELSPGQFIHAVRRAAEKDGAKVVVIDSLNGYLNAMPNERFLVIQLHEILAYLGQLGVATILIGAHQGVIGPAMTTPVDASYLADAVILLRYFESRGEVRQAISVMKKRGGAHERTIRPFTLANGRIELGEPLREFRGVLTGVPSFEGASLTERARDEKT